MVKFGNYIIKRFWIVLSVSFILLITGMVGFNQMPKKNMPNFNLPFALTTITVADESMDPVNGLTSEEFEHTYIVQFEEEALDLRDMDSVTSTISKQEVYPGAYLHFALIVTSLDGAINDSSSHWSELDDNYKTLTESLNWDYTSDDPLVRNVTFDSDFSAPQGAFFINGDDLNTSQDIADELKIDLESNVKDIVEIEIHNGSHFNNEEAVFLTYYLDDGIDQTNTRSDIKSVTDNYNSSNKYGSGTIVTLSSEPDDVAEAIGGVMMNLIVALFIVGIVVFVGLGIMNAIGVVTTIPVIIMSTSALLWISGMEVNTFTIAGIIISIGILVDNSIVISDSIQARIDNGTDRKTAAVKAIRDNWIPVAAATATTIAAFLPMLMLPGIAGKFIFMLPFTVMLTIAMSYVFAMTLMPVLATFLFKRNDKRAEKSRNNEYSKIEEVVNKASKWTLLHPIKTVAITVGVLVGTIAIAIPNMQFEIMPQAEINAITIDFSDPNNDSTGAQTTHDEIVTVLDQYDWVENYASTVGGELPTFSGLIFASPLQDYQGSFVIWIDDHYSNMANYTEILNKDFKSESIDVESNIVEMNFPGPAATASISLDGDFDETEFLALEAVAQSIYDEMVAQTDLISSGTIALPSDGAPVQRIDGKRVVTISMYSTVATEIEVGRALTDSVNKHISNKDYGVSYGGTYSQNSTMIWDMIKIFMFAMFVILTILIAQFRSVIKPFMVLSLVPFSFIGVLWIFLLSGSALSMTGMIGIVALTGLVVNAGILLVEQVRDGQADGMEPKAAIESAVMKRFRPISISALTTVVGLIPLAIAKDPFFTPMSLIMIGGLITSTFLALFTFPALLTFVTKNKVKKDVIKKA